MEKSETEEMGKHELKPGREGHGFGASSRYHYKQNASSTRQVKNWFQRTFTGEFDQSPFIKPLAVTFIALMGTVGFFAVLNSPAFTVYVPNPNYNPELVALVDSCHRYHIATTCASAQRLANDPSYPVGKFSDQSLSLGDFHTGGYTSVASHQTTCQWGTSTCLELGGHPKYSESGSVNNGGTAPVAATDVSVASGTDPPPCHQTVYTNGRIFTFYQGLNSHLNYTTATSPAATWTEHSTGANPFTMGESTEYCVAINGTTIYVFVTPRTSSNYFSSATLNADGTSTGWTWQTFTPGGSQLQDAGIAFDSFAGDIYLFWDCPNNSGCPNNGGGAQSVEQYQFSTNGGGAWSGIMNLMTTNPCANDILAFGTQLGNNSLLVTYSQFNSHSNPNCTNGSGTPRPGYFSRVLTGATVGPEETIPSPVGFGNLGLWDYTFNTATNQITGGFGYTFGDNNQTFAHDVLWAKYNGTAGASVLWGTPALPTGISLTDYSSLLALPGNSNALDCWTYDSVNQIYLEEKEGLAPSGTATTAVGAMLFDSNLNFLGPALPWMNVASYSYQGSGICPANSSAGVTNFSFLKGALPASILTFSVNDNPTTPVGYPGIAESQNPIGDLTSVKGKELEFQMNFALPTASTIQQQCNSVSTAGMSCSWGMFLTDNQTLWKTTNPAWSPYNDPNVQLALFIDNAGGNTWQQFLYLQQNNGETIAQEEPGVFGACPNQDSCYLSESGTNACVTVCAVGQSYFDLNYTGASQGAQVGTFTCPNGFGTTGSSGCSYTSFEMCQTNSANCGVQSVHGSPQLPRLTLPLRTYYLGFFVGAGQTGSKIDFCYDNGNFCSSQQTWVVAGCVSASMEFDYCVPAVPASPTNNNYGVSVIPDTGETRAAFVLVGIYNYIKNAFNNGGQKIFNTIINPIASIGGDIEGAVIAGLESAFALLSGSLKTVLNVAGTALGVGNLGDDAISFFTGVFNWFANILVPAFLWLATIGSVVGSGIAFITNIFSSSNPFIAQLTGFFQQIPGIIGVFGTYWNLFLYWFTGLTNAIQYLLVGMWVWLLYTIAEAEYGESTNKVMEFAGTIYRITGLIFDVGLEVIRFTTFFVVSVKQLIAGWI